MSRNGQKSKLNSLAPEQRAQLVKWLQEEKLTYRAVLDRLQEQFGLKSSMRALSVFWNGECGPALDLQYLLKETVLEVNIRVRQAGRVIGEADLRVSLAPTDLADDHKAEISRADKAGQGVSFDVAARHPNHP
jgi:hypothetical protein